jgi:hypothetical protein
MASNTSREASLWEFIKLLAAQKSHNDLGLSERCPETFYP